MINPPYYNITAGVTTLLPNESNLNLINPTKSNVVIQYFGSETAGVTRTFRVGSDNGGTAHIAIQGLSYNVDQDGIYIPNYPSTKRFSLLKDYEITVRCLGGNQWELTELKTSRLSGTRDNNLLSASDIELNFRESQYKSAPAPADLRT